MVFKWVLSSVALIKNPCTTFAVWRQQKKNLWTRLLNRFVNFISDISFTHAEVFFSFYPHNKAQSVAWHFFLPFLVRDSAMLITFKTKRHPVYSHWMLNSIHLLSQWYQLDWERKKYAQTSQILSYLRYTFACRMNWCQWKIFSNNFMASTTNYSSDTGPRP